jgi:hypothetical protein
MVRNGKYFSSASLCGSSERSTPLQLSPIAARMARISALSAIILAR